MLSLELDLIQAIAQLNVFVKEEKKKDL